jgi:ATP-dependent exoDNAse (exonuclease V) beta subunit
LDEKSFKDIENRVKRLLDSQDFLGLVKDAKFYKEQPLSFNKELKQLDLLIEKERNYIVIDYKSSKEDMYKHKKQILEYKKAIKDITKKDTTGYICYLLEDRIEMVKV